MRHASLVVIIISAIVLPVQAGIRPLGMGTTEANADSLSTSHFHGFSGTYPVLNPKRLEELNQRALDIAEDLEKMTVEMDRLHGLIDSLLAADTISVRKHMTLLGGLVRIPRLTRQEKSQLEAKQELEARNKEATKQLHRAEERVRQLENDQQELMDLMERHARVMERRILWGFISWDVKKTD